MSRYPGASWRPLGTQIEPRLEKKNVIVLHTMVGSLTGTDSYFRREGYGGVESHFGVGGSGLVYQWQDTDWQADAQLEGNDNAISIETADIGPEFPSWSGSNVPAWTSAQLDAIVKLCVWLCRTHNIPPVLVPDSAESRRGIGYHRQGIDPWRVPGTELWSNAYAKVCPGDRRIAQIKTVIVPRVAAALEDDMPTADEIVDALMNRVIDKVDPISGSTDRMQFVNFIRYIHDHVAKTRFALVDNVTADWTNKLMAAAARLDQFALTALPILQKVADGVSLTDEERQRIADLVDDVQAADLAAQLQIVAKPESPTP